MRQEDRILCLLTREEFTAQHEGQVLDLVREGDVDWHRLFLDAEEQRVSPLVHHNLDCSPVLHSLLPPAARADFKRAQIHNVLKKKESRRVLAALARCCEENDVDLLLVKGAALALFVHGKAWFAISGDIDVVLRPRPPDGEGRIDRVIRFAEQYNHTRSHLSEHIEYELNEHHDVSMNRVLPIPSDHLWLGARRVEVEGAAVHILSPEMMMLAACINACRKRYFYLKSLNDIAAICASRPDLNWEEVAARARLYRAEAIVYTALLMTQTMLGCTLPQNIWTLLQLNPLRRACIDHTAALLWRNATLTALSERHHALMGRRLSLPLLLTYLSYPVSALGAKLMEVARAWRNPSPAKPIDQDGRRAIADLG